MNPEYKPGDFVLPDQFIDFTKSRHTSFFDGGTNGVVHVDMTEPYCPTLRRNVIQAAAELGDCRLHDKEPMSARKGRALKRRLKSGCSKNSAAISSA